MKYLLYFSVLLGCGLLYLLSSSSVNTELFSANYYGVLALTGLLALGLACLAAYQFWQLRNKLKNKVFGAKLTLRLALFFIGIAVLPGILVYAVSVEFLGKSIESWFDVRVEKALEGGLNLGKSGLENSLQELSKKTQFVSLLLTEKQPAQFQQALQNLLNDGLTQDAAIFSLSGKPLAFVSTHGNRHPAIPAKHELSETLDKGQHSLIDAAKDGLMLRSMVLVTLNNGDASRYILQFTQPVPRQIAADAEMVQAVYRDYQELVLSRLSLKRLYGVTLTLSLLVVLLAAVSAAFFISDRLGSSLEALAEGTQAVALGDFTGQYPIRSSDELGALTGLFNQMTRQLADAKAVSELQQRQVERSKVYLESVLTHLSSGVLGFDDDMLLRSSNTSAVQILATPMHDMQRKSLDEIGERYSLLASFCQAISKGFAETANGDWQQQIERMSKQGHQILLMRGTRLPKGSGAGYVVVFDDISHLLQTERQAAWGEVARRLAHEIKNPLTPIQLSAERLQYRLSGKLDSADALLLQRATQTIVSQVAAMKNMVGDFANYARSPVMKMARLDLHQLLGEVLGLYDADAIPIALQLQAVHTHINGDATRLRQVIHNLLQNSQDALQGREHPQIILSTQNIQGRISLRIQDNGSGFPEQILARAFEPYMTTKPRGTGLGLAIVKKIIEDHAGHINIENAINSGASIEMVLPLEAEA